MLKNNQALNSNIGKKEIIHQTNNNNNHHNTNAFTTVKTSICQVSSGSNNKNSMNLDNSVMLSSLTSTLTSTSSF